MKKEQGFSLVEVLVAVLLLGVIAAAFLMGLTTASKALLVTDERATAKNLAESEMEYIGNCDYDLLTSPWSYELPTQKPLWDPDHDLSEVYEGYTVKVNGNSFDIDGDGSNDEDIQRITITVRHGTKKVLTLTDYKVAH